MKQMIILIMVSVMMMSLGACAPIEGIGGEEDNLPVIGENQDESVEGEVIELAEEVVEVTNEEVIPETEETTIIPNFVKIKADALNVRRDAGLEFEKIGKVFDGQIYPVLDTKQDSEGLPWHQLETPEGAIGWVSSEYCIPGESYELLQVNEETRSE